MAADGRWTRIDYIRANYLAPVSADTIIITASRLIMRYKYSCPRLHLTRPIYRPACFCPVIFSAVVNSFPGEKYTTEMESGWASSWGLQSGAARRWPCTARRALWSSRLTTTKRTHQWCKPFAVMHCQFVTWRRANWTMEVVGIGIEIRWATSRGCGVVVKVPYTPSPFPRQLSA